MACPDSAPLSEACWLVVTCFYFGVFYKPRTFFLILVVLPAPVSSARVHLQPIRCLDNAGTSSWRKDALVQLALQVLQVLEKTGLVGSVTAFRAPQQYTQSGAFPQPADGWMEWEHLRAGLPEFAGDAIIIHWLRQRGSIGGSTGRALYRGLQRVMDLGALGALRGIPPCGEGGGTLHLRST